MDGKIDILSEKFYFYIKLTQKKFEGLFAGYTKNHPVGHYLIDDLQNLSLKRAGIFFKQISEWQIELTMR